MSPLSTFNERISHKIKNGITLRFTKKKKNRWVRIEFIKCREVCEAGSWRSYLSLRTRAAFPQKCFYRGSAYSCGLGVSCWIQGKRPVDLCNGGVIWSCCVPRNAEPSKEGMVKDARKMHTSASFLLTRESQYNTKSFLLVVIPPSKLFFRSVCAWLVFYILYVLPLL